MSINMADLCQDTCFSLFCIISDAVISPLKNVFFICKDGARLSSLYPSLTPLTCLMRWPCSVLQQFLLSLMPYHMKVVRNLWLQSRPHDALAGLVGAFCNVIFCCFTCFNSISSLQFHCATVLLVAKQCSLFCEIWFIM